MKTEKLVQVIKDTEIDSRDSKTYVQIMAKALNEEQLKELKNYYYSNPKRDKELYWIIDREQDITSFKNRVKKELYDKVHRRNEPVKQLLDWYHDKRSGKVVYARKQLQERFLHLTYEEQIVVIRALLKGGKLDRTWCYNILRKWWSEELEEDILTAWNNFHEERCGWLFPMYMPVEVIREHLEELSGDSNYYQLCKRLVAEPWFEIDRQKLLKTTDAGKYMWIISQSDSGLTPEEAISLLFQEIFSFLADTERKFQSVYGPHSWFRVVNDIYVKVVGDFEDLFFMYYQGNIEKMLASMCRMGLQEEVNQFLTVDSMIHDLFLSNYRQEIGQLRSLDDKKYIFEKLGTLLHSYAEYLIKVLNDYCKFNLPEYRTYFEKDNNIKLQAQDQQWLEHTELKPEMTEAEFEEMKLKNPAISKLTDSLDLCPF